MQETLLEISLVTFLVIILAQQTTQVLEPIRVITQAIMVERYSFLDLELIPDLFQMGTWVSSISLVIILVLETILVIT